MTLSTETAVERLTQPWADVLSPDETGRDTYTTIDYPPLLTMLEDACRSSVGERSHGSTADASARSLINLEAHMLRNRIDGSVKTWINHLSKGRAEKGLTAAVVQLAGLLNAHHAAGTMPEGEYLRVSAFFARWCDQIWDLYDPPTLREVQQKCPRCQVEWMPGVEDGPSRRAVWVSYRGSLADAKAECRACGMVWGSLPAMRELGFELDQVA